MNPWQGLNSARHPSTPQKKACYRRPAPVYDNPWQLTPAQARAISALVEEGANVAAADRLGISIKTLEAQLTAAVKKMDTPTRLMAALTWDRYKRGLA